MVEPSEAIERLMRVEAGVPARGVYPDAVRPWDYYRRDCYFAADYLLHVRPNRPRPTPVSDFIGRWCIHDGRVRSCSWSGIYDDVLVDLGHGVVQRFHGQTYATESDALLALWHDRWEALVKIAESNHLVMSA